MTYFSLFNTKNLHVTLKLCFLRNSCLPFQFSVSHWFRQGYRIHKPHWPIVFGGSFNFSSLRASDTSKVLFEVLDPTRINILVSLFLGLRMKHVPVVKKFLSFVQYVNEKV